MPKHIHADLMMLYAKDALETDKPWERWEHRANGCQEFTSQGVHPNWWINFEYRRKVQPYIPALLDQTLELEIDSALVRAKHYTKTAWPNLADVFFCLVKEKAAMRKPEMIEYLKQQSKL